MNRRACLAVAFLTALALAGSELPAQEPGRPKPGVSFQGSQAFRHALTQLHLKPLENFDRLVDNPRRTLLIVFGRTDPLDELQRRYGSHNPGSAYKSGGLQNFLKQGGAILLATDRKVDPIQLQELGVAIGGQIVQGRPEKSYTKEPACPLVRNFDRNHPIFEGVNSIATNTPSYLSLSEGAKLRRLARFPADCTTVPVRGMDDEQRLPQNQAFVAGGELRDGRILVLAGHGVFFNGMMLRRDSDNDNFFFAANCLRWLTGPDGPRDRVLFFEEGLVVPNFDVPLRETPPPEPRAEDINRIIRGLENENFFNRAFASFKEELADRMPRGVVQRIVMVLLTAALALYGLTRLWRARHRREARVPLVATAVAEHAPHLPVIAQRQRAMLQEGNLWEAGRELAWQCFEEAGLPAEAAGPPRVEVTGPWLRRWRLRRLVGRLWQLARGAKPVRISLRQFSRLVAEVEEVKAALAVGHLRLEG
jgi:hypothetical protein